MELNFRKNSPEVEERITELMNLVGVNHPRIIREMILSALKAGHDIDYLADLKQLMQAEGIEILDRGDILAEETSHLADVFLKKVFPVLSPLAIDPAHPFPFIPNTGFALALELERTRDKRPLKALLPIPAQIDRFVRLPASEGKLRYLPLESLLLVHIDRLFPGYRIAAHFGFHGHLSSQ